MRCGLSWPLILGLVAAGCSASRSASSHSAGTHPPAPEPLSYVRISDVDSNHVQLQIAAREFLPNRRGRPVVWLTGVSHLGDPSYYAALQSHLNTQTLVLYEGVGAADAETEADSAPAAATPPAVESDDDAAAETPATATSDNRGSFQSAMAASLGLVFQLEAIDYRRSNFRNSDLSITQLRDLMNQAETGSGQHGASQSFENLLGMMEGNSWFDALLQLALRLLGANPKFQALGRLALIDLLGQIQGDPSRLQGLPPEMKQLLEVLLQRRNEKVIADLTERLSDVGPHGSIAIFFGTGHMPDMEKRLRNELQYHPATNRWFTAFDVDLAKAKITPAEREFVDSFVQWQLTQAGASHAGPDSAKPSQNPGVAHKPAPVPAPTP